MAAIKLADRRSEATQDFVGPIEAKIRDKGGAFHNPTAYGGWPGPANDNTVLLKSILTDRIAADGAGELWLPQGDWYISEPLEYPSNFILDGPGTLRLAPDLSTANPLRMLMPNADGVENVIIRSVVIDQNGGTGTGEYTNNGSSPAISVQATRNVALSLVRFKNVITMAVWCDSRGATYTRKLRILGCDIDTSMAGGFSFFGQLEDFSLINNTIYDVRDDAIALQSVIDAVTGDPYIMSDFALVGNTIRDSRNRDVAGSTPHGILLYGCEDGTVGNNKIKRTANDGIIVLAALPAPKYLSRDITIIGNQIKEAGDPHGSHGITWGGNGINVMGGYNIIVSSNPIKGSRGAGVMVRNTVDDSTGAHEFASAKVKVDNNMLIGNREGAVIVQDAEWVTVNDNECFDNGHTATAGTRNAITVISTVAGRANNIRIVDNRGAATSHAEAGFLQEQGIKIVGAPDKVTSLDNEFNGNHANDDSYGGATNLTVRDLSASTVLTGSVVIADGTTPSIADDDAWTVDVSVPGAVSGDHVSVSWSNMPNGGVSVTGYVIVAGDVVHAVFLNKTGAVWDPGAGTLRALVTPQ